MNAKNFKDSISLEDVKTYRESFIESANDQVLMNTINVVGIKKAGTNREVLNQTNHLFNNKVDNWEVMDQKQSGRCWIFAGMNLYKPALCKKLKIKDIHLSANYVQFWDFIEKANLFFNNIKKTADESLDSRLVQDILGGSPEGGWWDMFIAIVDKYGIVPNQAMPDTVDASQSIHLSRILASYMRSQAKVIRQLAQSNSVIELQKLKQNFLKTVYRISAMHLGVPPEKFDWEYETEDKKVITLKDCKPLDFARDLKTQQCITLINDPRPQRPYMKHYTSEYTGNVESRPLDFLNVDVETLKSLVKKMIDNGQSVWMSCDVSKNADHENGIFNEDLYNFNDILNIPPFLSKADRLDYNDGGGNHAMLFTGYHEIDGKITKWRIENSWGDKKGKKGYYELSDKWFDEHVYTSLISKEFLSEDHMAVLEEPVIKLMPWELPY